MNAIRAEATVVCAGTAGPCGQSYVQQLEAYFAIAGRRISPPQVCGCCGGKATISEIRLSEVANEN